jgi:Fur family transcriptional regulator, ferric uptake regulator
LPGKRQTRQRLLVNEVVQASDGPLTVPEIHQQVCRRMPRTGIATVYRAVKLLLEKGWIQAVTLPTGDTRYESAELGHHHHFQCTECHRVFDIDHCPFRLPKGTELPGGFILRDHEMTLYGECPACRKKAGNR